MEVIAFEEMIDFKDILKSYCIVGIGCDSCIVI